MWKYITEWQCVCVCVCVCVEIISSILFIILPESWKFSYNFISKYMYVA